MNIKNLKSLFNKHDFRPSKRKGQVFLIDDNILSNIYERFTVENTDCIVEVGPGFGNLTSYLVKDSKQVVAIEKDAKLANMICDYLGTNPSNLKIICEDILKVDLEKIFKMTSGKVKVIGNLPYYITSPIISRFIEYKDFIQTIQITIQKEVAQRILAKPSTKEYGFLTLLVQFHFEVSKLFDISKNCFLPVPKVDSATLSLKVKDSGNIRVNDEKFLFKLIDVGFKQRRKMLINVIAKEPTLNIDKPRIVNCFNKLALHTKARAENFALCDFIRLSNALESF